MLIWFKNYEGILIHQCAKNLSFWLHFLMQYWKIQAVQCILVYFWFISRMKQGLVPLSGVIRSYPTKNSQMLFNSSSTQSSTQSTHSIHSLNPPTHVTFDLLKLHKQKVCQKDRCSFSFSFHGDTHEASIWPQSRNPP